MQNLKLVFGITVIVTLLVLILGTPCAMAQDSKPVTMPVLVVKVVVPHCTVRQLDQGRGSVRICE